VDGAEASGYTSIRSGCVLVTTTSGSTGSDMASASENRLSGGDTALLACEECGLAYSRLRGVYLITFDRPTRVPITMLRVQSCERRDVGIERTAC